MDDMDDAEFELKYGRLAGHDLMKVRCGKCGRVLKMRRPGKPEPAWVGIEVNPRDVPVGGGAWWMPCHRRCGADWRRSGIMMHTALLAARKAGKREVMVGVDV